MSLSDVHNPKAAAELIERFRRRFSTKVCMAPMLDHEPPIVSAHTLSVEAMLRKIAVGGHVYAPGQPRRIASDTFPIEVQRKGVRDVSVFNGFCSKHDRELFSCLETEPFRFTRQQLFMLAYRASARECYLKRKQAETLPSAEEYAAIHGIKEKVQLGEAALIYKAASLRGAEEAETLKAILDGYLVQSAWDRVITHAVLFPKPPSVLATAAFQPFFDMDGNQLQEFDNLKAEMSQFFISLIPVDTGAAAIFSWLDTANTAPRRFFESVLRGQDKTSTILHAVLDNTENVAFAPVWYESLTQEQRDYVFSRLILFEASMTYSEGRRPDDAAPKLDAWGEANVAPF